MTTAEFQREFRSHSEPPSACDVAGVVSNYVKTRDATLSQVRQLGVGNDGAREVRRKLAGGFVRQWMMLRYPAIDLSFTSRPWWIRVERDDRGSPRITDTYDAEPAGEPGRPEVLTGKVERFFRAKAKVEDFALRSKCKWEHPSIKLGGMPVWRRGKAGTRSAMDVYVSAAVPDGITPEHVHRSRAAMAHYHIGIAALYAKGIDLHREIADEDKYGYRSRDVVTGDVTVLWAPLQHALSVEGTPTRPNGDPAIIYTIAGKSFLLDFFDTPDEAPIEHLVREFTEGRLSRP